MIVLVLACSVAGLLTYYYYTQHRHPTTVPSAIQPPRLSVSMFTQSVTSTQNVHHRETRVLYRHEDGLLYQTPELQGDRRYDLIDMRFRPDTDVNGTK